MLKRDIAIAGAAVAAGAGAAVLALASEREASPAVAAALAVVVGWAYIGSGLIAWRQRPENRLGRVMVFIGFAWFATFAAHADAPLPFTLGTALENVYLLGFVYLVLAFPGGTLQAPADRALVACAVALVTVVQLAWLSVADSQAVICSDCPDNAFQVARNDAIAEGILQAQRVAGVVLSAVTVALLAGRWRRASAARRRSVAPVVWTGGAMFGALAISIANDVLGEPLGPVAGWTSSCVFAAIPLAVLGVLLRRRLARGTVAGLVVELGAGAAPRSTT